jgi:hypothetical protein
LDCNEIWRCKLLVTCFYGRALLCLADIDLNCFFLRVADTYATGGLLVEARHFEGAETISNYCNLLRAVNDCVTVVGGQHALKHGA